MRHLDFVDFRTPSFRTKVIFQVTVCQHFSIAAPDVELRQGYLVPVGNRGCLRRFIDRYNWNRAVAGRPRADALGPARRNPAIAVVHHCDRELSGH